MVDDYSVLGFETRAIHAGQKPDPRTGAVIVPIYQTSTYAQDGVGGTREGDYEYSRTANPTRTALEEALASLEGGRHALAFASGMAASDVVLRSTLRPGDHLVLGNDAYGGTFRLIDKVLSLWGVEHTVADLGEPRRGARRDPAGDEADLVRVADQPDARHRRHRRAGRCRARRRRPPGGRQHLRDAVPAEPALAGRGHRAALDDASTSAATPTSSAARSSPTRTSCASSCSTCATPRARCPGRSTPG